MTKAKSNASWNQLTPKQRERLDRWLFEENLSYADVLIRASRELGYKGSQSSLRRYYERRRQERLLTDLKEVGQDMMEVQGLNPDIDPDLSRKVSMQMLGAYLFRMLREAPDKVKEWAPVANLLVQNDRNEALRAIKAEDQKIRREALAFAKEKFEFDATEQAIKALPRLKELDEARKDPNTRRYEENVRWNRARKAVFGMVNTVHPESAQEEAEMLAAKRERDARQKAERETSAEQEQIRQELGGAQPPPPSSRYYAEYMAREAENEAKAHERERAYQESRAKAREAAKAEEKKSQEERQAEAAETERTRQEKLRKEQEAQARLEELREVCGWQEVQKPPGMEEG